ncbi:transposase [Myxosarcina sp. GI1]|uniref:transposase n=1 Tax=Myxosarcina sp. GI1 TaxID=1541065 RepID=UPI0009DD1773|nr:transposase [Myxosarcina sp. GI1]
MTCLDYCQYLLVSQINYTLTNFADHSHEFSHDKINRFLKGEKITPRLIWENVKSQLITSESGYLIFDDTVLDKNFSDRIELVRRQYSGNAKKVIKGIGVVTCIYVNPAIDQFWLIDYRVYDCPLKNNRQVDDASDLQSYQRVDSLEWNNEELDQGKIIKIKGFPKEHKVKLFRVEVSTHRTDYVVTNDFTQDSTEATHQTCGFRWKIEQLHREGKQLTGWEKCQCRKARIQRNAARTRRPPQGGWEALLPLGCSLLVWVRLKYLAIANNSTVYQLKNDLLDRYLIQQLKNPSLKMALA